MFLINDTLSHAVYVQCIEGYRSVYKSDQVNGELAWGLARSFYLDMLFVSEVK